MIDRLKQLEAIARSQPNNPFALYSLAMEKKKTDLAGALAVFEQIRASHPSYVPNYYQYAKALETSGEEERARAVYREGIEAAQSAGDLHAEGELRAALELLSDA